MKMRLLGKTGFTISEVGLGTWQVGGKWGTGFSHSLADDILNKAVDNGVNFIDTADVYESGESEKAVGRLVKSRRERIYVATKCGRRLWPHTNEAYKPEILKKFVEDSLKNMGLETLDLIQLHCMPAETYNRPEIFDLFNTLKSEGKILNLGVSVGTISEAQKAIEYENVSTVQIIFNMFRQRPADHFFAEAAEKNVGIIVRVPLASGLLTGKFSKLTTFNSNDHRSFDEENALDYGETFSGIDYEKGLAIVEDIKKVFPANENLASNALKWVLMFPEVSCVIPGASSPNQLLSNILASQLPHLSSKQMEAIKNIYNQSIKPLILEKSWY
jgi:aryl-alcohol dehydrogenase-like predicted oxidoreductase